VRRANAGGAGGDGLLQRFGLIVWPDAPATWRDIDTYPNSQARDSAWGVFDRVGKINEAAALKMGAEKGHFDKLACFRFDDEAHADFLDWRTDLERRLRSGEMSPALEGHLAKYRKLLPALALVTHVADQGQGPVTHRALLRALAFADYLETHARRLYGSSTEAERRAGEAVLKKIRRTELRDGFTARDIHRAQWSNLTEIDLVKAGLNLLADLDHVAPVQAPVGPSGGRSKTTYLVNPRTLS
jgi:hypothetical protein